MLIVGWMKKHSWIRTGVEVYKSYLKYALIALLPALVLSALVVVIAFRCPCWLLLSFLLLVRSLLIVPLSKLWSCCGENRSRRCHCMLPFVSFGLPPNNVDQKFHLPLFAAHKSLVARTSELYTNNYRDKELHWDAVLKPMFSTRTQNCLSFPVAHLSLVGPVHLDLFCVASLVFALLRHGCAFYPFWSRGILHECIT